MIVAFTGAGISKASGIPTFEDMGDLRTKLDRDFAQQHPIEFNQIMYKLTKTCLNAYPNDAHYALKDYDIPIITMNIDDLHKRAGTIPEHMICVHGSLSDHSVVLYGDSAPKYQEAYDWVDRLNENDIFLVIGSSFYTNFARTIYDLARSHGVRIYTINENAEHNVRYFLETHSEEIENFDDFMERPICYSGFIPYLY